MSRPEHFPVIYVFVICQDTSEFPPKRSCRNGGQQGNHQLPSVGDKVRERIRDISGSVRRSGPISNAVGQSPIGGMHEMNRLNVAHWIKPVLDYFYSPWPGLRIALSAAATACRTSGCLSFLNASSFASARLAAKPILPSDPAAAIRTR